MKCNKCIHENNVSAKFCSSCGKALAKEKKKLNKVALVILSLVVLYLLTFFVYPYFFPKELYKIEVGDKYGFIDNKGNMVIKPRFRDVGDFSEGYAVVELKNNKVGFINKLGKITFPKPKNLNLYNSNYIGECKNGRFRVRDNNYNYGFLNTNGEIAVKLTFNSDIENFSDKRARFKKNGEYGFIDTDGRIVIKPEYYEANNFKEGFSRIKLEDGEKRYNYIDRNGKKIRSTYFYSAEDFSEGLALVKKDKKSKYGFIDDDGDWAISARFYSANSFENGIAKVKINEDDDYIFIDLNGKEINK